jgi:hypothetical protein
MRRPKDQLEPWFRARSERTDEQERIQLILRGTAFGEPLHVPAYLWPCSICLRLRSWRLHFQHARAAGTMRCEPVCDECWGKDGQKTKTA